MRCNLGAIPKARTIDPYANLGVVCLCAMLVRVLLLYFCLSAMGNAFMYVEVYV